MNERPVRHLNQIELSRRWSLSPRTLEGWRCRGRGPCFLKIGGRIVYRLDDIEAFEAEQRREAGWRGPHASSRPQEADGQIRFPLACTPSNGVANGFAHRHPPRRPSVDLLGKTDPSIATL
jgi:hypothetical protein